MYVAKAGSAAGPCAVKVAELFGKKSAGALGGNTHWSSRARSSERKMAL